MNIILDKPSQIDMYRLYVLRQGLKLESIGMQRSRRPSCFTIVRKEFGLKGNKSEVLAQFNAIIAEKENELGIKKS